LPGSDDGPGRDLPGRDDGPGRDLPGRDDDSLGLGFLCAQGHRDRDRDHHDRHRDHREVLCRHLMGSHFFVRGIVAHHKKTT
jgi:hypothetical protein